MRTVLLLVAATLLLSANPGAGGSTALAGLALDSDSVVQWKLPTKLREISGLATLGSRLFAHGDEQGIVYEIDYDDGRLLKAFALGRPTVRGDFEGIAIVGDRFYMVTSDGVLYEFEEGANGERVAFARYVTGLGELCELEGLVHDTTRGNLLLVCKQPRVEELRDTVAVFAWSLRGRQLQPDDNLMIPRQALTEGLGGGQFNPSGIELHPESGHLLLVAARQRTLAEIDRSGQVIGVVRLPRANLHRQAEGIALLPDGRLALADEGGSKKGRLALYRPAS